MAAFTLPKLHKSIRLNSIISLGGFLGFISYLLYAISCSMKLMYFAGLVGGFATVYAGTLAVQLVISNWYVKKRSIILGIVAAASGVGSALFSPIFGEIIDHYGWRMVCFCTAGIIFIAVFCVSMFFIKQSPSSVGIEAYGASCDREKKTYKRCGVALNQVVKTRQFFLYFFGMIAVAFVYRVITSSQSAILIEKGSSLQTAAYCLSVFSITDICCKTMSGVVIERHGFLPVALYCSCMAILGVAVIQLFKNSVAVMLFFSFCMGFWPTMLVLYGFNVSSEIFGDKHLQQFVSFSQTVMNACAIMMGFIINFMFQGRGNYDLLLISVLIVSIVFVPVMILLLQYSHRHDVLVEQM